MINVKKCLQIAEIFALVAAGLLLSLLLIFARYPTVADLVDLSAGRAMRSVLSFLFSFLPISAAELLLLLSPLIILLIFRAAIRARSPSRFLLSLSAMGALLFSLYALTLGFAYHKTSLPESLGITAASEYSVPELTEALSYLSFRINELSDSERTVELSEIHSALTPAFSRLSGKTSLVDPGIRKPKPILFSPVASRLSLLGFYFPYTAEPLINTSQPSYMIPFTAAHEVAHAKGVAKEAEANLVAFLVTTESADPFVRYSGYLSAFELIAADLYTADPSAYFDILAALPNSAIDDMRSSEEFLSLSKNPPASILESANDIHLKLNGDAGAVAYTLSSSLIISYLNSIR